MNFSGSQMFNNLTNRFFRKIDNLVWDLSSGKIGVTTDEGIVTLELGEVVGKTAENASVRINPITDFGFAVPGFATSVPVDQIALGDVIYNPGKKRILGWVVAVKDNGKFDLLKEDGTSGHWTPPSANIMGFDAGTMVVRSLVNMLGGTSGVDALQGNMMQMMMMSEMMGGSGNDTMESMVPFMLMSQLGMGGVNNNMMSQMMPMLMMSKMFGGNNSGRTGAGNNFFDTDRRNGMHDGNTYKTYR